MNLSLPQRQPWAVGFTHHLLGQTPKYQMKNPSQSMGGHHDQISADLFFYFKYRACGIAAHMEDGFMPHLRQMRTREFRQLLPGDLTCLLVSVT